MAETVNEQLRKMLNDAFDANKPGATKEVASKILEEDKERINRQHSYRYDYSNFNILDNEMLEKERKLYFFKNSLRKKLLKAVKIAAKEGISGLLLRIGDKSPITQNVHLLSLPEMSNEVLTEVYLSENYINSKEIQGKNVDVMKLYLNDDGKYVLSHERILVKDTVLNLEDGVPIMKKNSEGDLEPLEYVYESIDFCPLELLDNNEDQRGDFEYALERLRISAKFSAIVEAEWEYEKVIMMNNLAYNPDKTATEVQAAIQTGKERVMEIADPDGKLQSALSYLQSGGVTTDIAAGIKNNYKDEVKELTFSFGSMDGGNNKHTTEVIGTNVDALSYLFIKKGLFSEFLNKYVYKLLSILSLQEYRGFKFNDEEEMLEITVQLSRPLEILLNMNADGTEQDANTRVNENINTNVDATGEDKEVK